MVTLFLGVVGTDQNKHRNPATTWWNTYLVNYHFGQLFYALETYGDPDAFYAKLGWTKGMGHFRFTSGHLYKTFEPIEMLNDPVNRATSSRN